MNHLIPYVPIAPRTKAENEKATAHCKKLFTLVDELAQNTHLEFNHSATLGQLAINPEHFGDCAIEYGANRPNFSLIQSHLEQLRYPVFQGEHTIKSALWDCETTVWLFQLNQTRGDSPMKTLDADTVLALDQATSIIKTWRKSLEVSGNHELTYSNTELLYTLLAIEEKLDVVVAEVEAQLKQSD